MKNEAHKSTISDVFEAFWEGVKPQQAVMWFIFACFTVASILTVITPLFYKRFFDVLANQTLNAELQITLIKILFIVLGINLLNVVLMRVSGVAISSIESRTMARLRQKAFDYMINHSYSFFTNSFTGSLTQRINRFSRAFERVFDTIVFQIIPLSINILGALIVLYFQKPFIAKIFLLWIVSILILHYLFARWKLKYDLVSAQADTTTTALLSDNITNQNSIILFNNFEKESESFAHATENQAKAQRTSWNLSTHFDGVQALLIALVEFGVFYYAVKYRGGNVLTIGTLVLIQSYILGLSQRLWNFGKIIRNFYESYADAREMVDIMVSPHEIKNLPGATSLKVHAGEIEFKNVYFEFKDGRQVLKDFNLRVNSGEKIALIGPSGAGKSTIVKTLLRMYDLTSGSILIDGQDIKSVTQESLHQNISLVPQDPVLFHRSLLENIRYGKPEATEAEAIEAARLAHCDEFIEELPLKYDTLVGERGIKLSGGERQRIAIARAILKNAPILILDEATSSLDSHSESLIQDALEVLMKGKTSIVIAHRLSTIRKMDRIVVIEDGKVLEDGDHESLLLNDSGLYKKLWNLQAGGFIKDN